MATEAPEKEINEHGDEVQKPRFGGRKSWGDTHEFGLPGADSPKDLADKETAAGSGAKSKVPQSEKGFVKDFNEKKGGLGLAGAAISGSPVGKIGSIFFKNRKRQAATGLATLTIGGGILVFSILQGPLQFVHFAQLLQKFHLSRNEDFGDGRGAKLMLYAMAGAGERGRLGAVANGFADRWENRMVEKTGLRPLYRAGNPTRLIGYEIVSDKTNKADALNDILDRNPKLRQAYERMKNNGAEIRTLEEATDRGALRGTASRSGLGTTIDPGHFILDGRDLNDRGFKELRIFNRAVGGAMVGPRIPSGIGSRVLEKRGGIKFSFFNNQKRTIDKRADANTQKKQAEDYKKSVLKRWADAIKFGVKGGAGKTNESKVLLDDVNQQIEADPNADPNSIRTAAAKAAGPAAAVGILCGVKSFGDDADNAKYAYNVLPMMRMGFGVIAMGNQAMSGERINLDEMGVMNEQLFDKENNTSWTNARSIQAELGQPQTGPDVPGEARLAGIGDKPDFFEAIDKAMGVPLTPGGPFLTDLVGSIIGVDVTPRVGTACDVIDKVSGLPIVEEINAIIIGAINVALGVAGTSVEEALAAAIGVINGDSVNALAKGAEFGNLANVGAFLAGNDQAISTGGAALSDAEALRLHEQQDQFDRDERSQKQFFARYFDPYDQASLSGKIIDNAPASTAQAASMINPIKSIGDGFSGLFSSLQPKAQAAQKYDYGVKTYGFPLADQENDMFEDPYENAEIVEPRLTELNEKYGKCFGMTVDDAGMLHYDKAVNIFKLEKDPEFKDCRDDKNQEIYKRYQFYIGDTVTLKSLACFEDDEAACAELGSDGTSGNGGSGTAAPAAGEVVPGVGAGKIVAVAEAEFDKNGNKLLETCGENCGPEVQKYTGGPSGPSAPWCAWFVSWVYREAGYEFSVPGGNIPAVVGLASWFKSNGTFFVASSTKKPQPGDVIMYNIGPGGQSTGSEHTGIVVKVTGNTIETIEGNTSPGPGFEANGGTVGRKTLNYLTYNERPIAFGRLTSF